MKTRDRRHSDHLRWSSITEKSGMIRVFTTFKPYEISPIFLENLRDYLGCQFDLWVEPYVGWVCCWFSPFLLEVLLRVLRFSHSSKTNIFKFQFDQELGRRRTTLWMCYLQIVIYLLFIYLFVTWGLEPTNKRIGIELMLISPINRWLALKFFYLTMENFHE